MFEESPFSGVCSAAVWEVLLMLVGTFLLGLLLGYLIWGKLRGEISRLKRERSTLLKKIEGLELDVRTKSETIEELNDKVKNLERNIASLQGKVNSQQRTIEEQVGLIKTGASQLVNVSGRANALRILLLQRLGKEDNTQPQTDHAAKRSAPVVPGPDHVVEAPFEFEASEDVEEKVREYSPKSLSRASEIFGKDVTANDLQLVEGIGPMISELLQNSGISTWEKLGKTSTMLLRVILDEAGAQFRVHKPKTWPRQAQMAASEEWKKLKAYQDVLQGGKEKKS